MWEVFISVIKAYASDGEVYRYFFLKYCHPEITKNVI